MMHGNKDSDMKKEHLYRRLEAYSRESIYPFHMPGHKRNPFCLPSFFPVGEDITEIDGFDNLHHPEGILREAQDRLAEVYGVLESFYSVNGSTAALLAAVSASVKRGGTILMARNCHKAAYHAVYLRDLHPVYLYPQTEPELWINGGIMPGDVEKSLREHPEIQAVLITSPTYDGVVSDIKKIAEITRRFEISLIVDEAHGAHFHFSSYFPVSAAELGADLVIQSLHKTLPSLTQTAVLHRCSSRTDREELQRFMGIYQSSSPSYILMASIDACAELLKLHGEELFRRYVSLLDAARGRLSECRRIRLFDPGKNGGPGMYDYDRSKLVLSAGNAALTGKQLQRLLLERYRLQMEMASERYVIALTSPGDTQEGFERLCGAVEELDREGAGEEESFSDKNKFITKLTDFPCAVMSIASAMEAPGMILPIEESRGRISAEFVYLYPPGTPILVPGEQITGQIIENVRRYIDQGLDLQGLADYSGRTIRVVR